MEKALTYTWSCLCLFKNAFTLILSSNCGTVCELYVERREQKWQWPTLRQSQDFDAEAEETNDILESGRQKKKHTHTHTPQKHPPPFPTNKAGSLTRMALSDTMIITETANWRSNVIRQTSKLQFHGYSSRTINMLFVRNTLMSYAHTSLPTYKSVTIIWWWYLLNYSSIVLSVSGLRGGPAGQLPGTPN